jgi:hypothetical protein
MRRMLHQLAALVAVVALLLPCVSALAESLSAAELPACCNTSYCPVHHRQARDLQKDKSNCAGLGAPAENDCSMRSCDTAPHPVVGTPAFVLVTPVTLRSPSIAGAAPVLALSFFHSIATIPLYPPPRTFPG